MRTLAEPTTIRRVGTCDLISAEEGQPAHDGARGRPGASFLQTEALDPEQLALFLRGEVISRVRAVAPQVNEAASELWREWRGKNTTLPLSTPGRDYLAWPAGGASGAEHEGVTV